MGGLPCLLQLLELFSWPGVDELVHGPGVVDNDLVCRVHVLGAVYIVGDI